MIRTFKIKHGLDLSPSLFAKAQQVANYVLDHKGDKKLSSKHVKHFGLYSAISAQIIRKYNNNKKLKKIRLERVKLIIPGQAIKLDKELKTITLAPHRSFTTSIKCWFPTQDIVKINQVELDKKYAYVCVTLPDVEQHQSENYIGIDLNSTSHSIVVASPLTRKVMMLGAEIPHLKKKYRNIRRNLAKKKKFKELKKVKQREHFKTLDIIRKISKKIVVDALAHHSGIKMEDLKGIRKRCTKKYNKEANHTLNSWPFFMVRQCLTNKAIQLGVEILFIDPKYTSQQCSKCGHIDKKNRNGKCFACVACKHVDHADVNAAFNIASRPKIDRTNFRSRGQIESSGAMTAKPVNSKIDLKI